MTASSPLNPVRTQVLVVGAGPVGLMAALTLRRQGIEVRVVDQQAEHRAHTFPVVLHPQSLRLLDELGLSTALFWRGHAVTRLALYIDQQRRAVLDLPAAEGASAGALTLPQDVLRQALATELATTGVRIEWNTRLAVLQQDGQSTWGRLSREDSARRSLGARAELDAFEADFVIGSDGYDSTVREALGIQLVNHGRLQSFAFFDAPTQRAGREAQLALTEDEYCSSVYPLQNDQSRFSFQLSGQLDNAADASALQQLLLARLPWYGEEVAPPTWGGVAEFRRALVNHFGLGRVWLAGEAAHLTGPLGVQSLNVGLDEANELACRMVDALQRPARPSFGEHYGAKRTRQWQELLGLRETAAISTRTPDWARLHASRLLACLPASGPDLDELLAQLRLTRAVESTDELT